MLSAKGLNRACTQLEEGGEEDEGSADHEAGAFCF